MEIYFGDVPGVKVGQCFKNRKALREAGIHAPLIAGIWGAQEGACSIVLSGGYEDDIDDLTLLDIQVKEVRMIKNSKLQIKNSLLVIEDYN